MIEVAYRIFQENKFKKEPSFFLNIMSEFGNTELVSNEQYWKIPELWEIFITIGTVNLETLLQNTINTSNLNKEIILTEDIMPNCEFCSSIYWLHVQEC